MKSGLVFVKKSNNIQQLSLDLWMVLQIAFREEFSHLPGGLGHCADSNSIPKKHPTIFHPSLIATRHRTFLLTLFVRLFPQCLLPRIDEVSKYSDSKICQIPMNCQYKWLSAFPTARETFVNSFPSLVKSLFCTDRTESTEWQDLVPRQRIGVCFEFHLPRWGLCDQPVSSHQTFLHEVELRQCDFCKEPL